MRAAVYCRLSRKPEEDGNIAQQEERGCETVERAGWTLVDVFVDDGISAWKDDAVRPAFQKVLSLAQSSQVDVIVARKMDRLTRNYLDWGLLHQSGVRFSDWSGQVMDTFQCGIEVAISNRESTNTSERTRLAEVRRVDAGKPPRGGRRHFGYHSGTCCDDGCEHHAVRDDEAAVVREMAERWLAGEKLRPLARELTARGVRHTSGKEFNYQTLKRVLQSPRVAAIRVHRGEEVRGKWEPIIDADLHARLVAADGKSASRRAPTRYLLTGLLVCGTDGCGVTLNGHMHAPTRRRYACHTCRRNGIVAQPVEEALWNVALGRTWERDRLAEDQVAERLGQVERELREARASLDELDDDYWQRRAIPKQTYTRQSTALRDRVGKLEDDLRQLRRERERVAGFWTNLIALTDTYETATPEQRRAVLEGAIRRVVLHPMTRQLGARVDLDRLEVEWRDGEVTRGVSVAG